MRTPRGMMMRTSPGCTERRDIFDTATSFLAAYRGVTLLGRQRAVKQFQKDTRLILLGLRWFPRPPQRFSVRTT